MLHLHNSTTSALSEDRETRIQTLLDQLRPAADQALRHMVEQLVDAPEQQLFGDLELRLRDQAHQLAATVHETGLHGRKKGGTVVPAVPVPTVSVRPVSSTT